MRSRRSVRSWRSDLLGLLEAVGRVGGLVLAFGTLIVPLKTHGFRGYGLGKVGIIFKLKILRAARRTFTLLPMNALKL
jgi:hypothetical protein